MSCIATLKEKGLKLTPQRRLIVDIIHDARGHLSAEEIIQHAQAKMPGVNKSTIYSTLELLGKAGCIYKSELSDGSIYHHEEEGHHHHLVCSKCSKTVDCNEDIFVPVERLLWVKHGFQIDFKHVVIGGLCKSCRNEKT